MKSTTFSINWNDFLKGLLISVLAPVLIILYNTVSTGSFDIDWKQVLTAGASAGLAYIIKNFFTNDTSAAIKLIEKQGGQIKDAEGNNITSK